MSFTGALSTVLDDPTTIHFISNTDNPDLYGLDPKKNPQFKSAVDGFAWYLPNKTEPVITVIGKVIYSVAGDRAGRYFNLPEIGLVCPTPSLCPIWHI